MRLTAAIGTCLLVLTLLVSSSDQGFALQSERYDELKRFSQVLDLVERYYVRDVTRKELVEGAVQGMLEKLDPHSMYMPAQEFSEMQANTSGEFSGIGIEISMRDGRLLVVSPIEDTPAYKAGLLAGDTILEIDGESTQNVSLIEAVRKIRGPKGSEVVLTVIGKEDTRPRRVPITRDTIPIISVKSDVLENGYVLLRLTRFNEHTTDELHEALETYASKNGGIDGIVLDLRNNPGGLLDQAVSVADTFLADGLVVYIQGKAENSRNDFTAAPQATDIESPMVVLINAGSASASEIVAGALQDRNRAVLVGEQTFGKGSVQTIIPLADGAGVKMTTALYYTPSGRSIQAEGIIPDFVIPFEPPAKDKDADSIFSVLREKDLSGHLENDGSGENGDADGSFSQKVDEMLKKDNQLRMALQLVKNLPRIREIK